jgi:hypothetical protein
VTNTLADKNLTGRFAEQPLSPELALVDPELARLARARLPAPGETIRVQRNGATALAPEVERRRTKRFGRPAGAAGLALGAAVLAFALSPHRSNDSVIARQAPLAAVASHDKADLHQAKPGDRNSIATRVRARTRRTRRTATTARRTAPPNSALRAPPTRRVDTRARHRTRQARPVTTAVPNPPAHSTVPRSAFSTRTFVWPPAAHATLYKVEFYREGKKIFEASPSEPRLELPVRWVHAHRTYTLTPGTYEWVVRPAFGGRTHLRYGKPIVQSSWVAEP